MTDAQHYDVIVVGTGAGGGTIAHRLAPTGKRILLLERGDYLPRERDNWDSTAVFVKGKYRAPEFWFDKHGNQFPPEVNYYVGGNTKFYGAALFRMRPEDFGELRHHDAISPAWPLSYEELEPYYTQAEHLYLVHGLHGEDATEGPASAQYAYPPVQHEPRIQQLGHDLEKQGLHPFRLPIGVNLTPGRSVTSVVATVGDRGGEGSTAEFGADIVVVACGAVNSAVLLLRSANDRHPRGLANSSDVVGRNYMRHNNLALMAVSKEPNDTRFQKTLAVHDWYLGSDDWEFPLGGIQMLGKSDSEQIHGEAPRWAGAACPDMPFEVLAHHAVDFWLCGEDLPTPDNRVTLDRDGGIHLALDVDCKAHDLDNLYVVDTSFFPSIGAVNPSLTAIANALRVGDRIADRLR
ncbi:GMC oxidoreductase [Streptomyces olivochromogenes]|uniref:GMC oxidoreductase n=1 Tax=Streptomyces olivochromogenes TaxID=1963 RepID=UPI0036DB5021